jgi:hypothetical protein
MCTVKEVYLLCIMSYLSLYNERFKKKRQTLGKLLAGEVGKCQQLDTGVRFPIFPAGVWC